jgi:demethylmenaquinone methyltransferase/2-methoxy-6-polyprenyl-1,4-benzoquinol methylase
MKQNELPFVREMFDRIAPRYDLLNRILSLRRDVFWRKKMVDALGLSPHARVLDAACGTGDVGLQIMHMSAGTVRVIGIDFAAEMLRRAKSKIARRNLRGKIHLAAADAFDLPFGPECFDAVSMAFGIRNIQDKLPVLKRFYEHLKPGGRLAILELATPGAEGLQKVYLYYFNRLLPAVGRLFSRHRYAYTYLPTSVAGFPPADCFAGLMRQAGLERVRYLKLTLGIAVLFVGDKPK